MSTDYQKYRGKCKKLSEAACRKDPTLTIKRGWYYCPIINKDEEHWWTVREDGSIYDPSRKQFPSKGYGYYTEYEGFVECAECGKQIPENEIIHMSRYYVCSDRCAMNLVGLGDL